MDKELSGEMNPPEHVLNVQDSGTLLLQSPVGGKPFKFEIPLEYEGVQEDFNNLMKNVIKEFPQFLNYTDAGNFANFSTLSYDELKKKFNTFNAIAQLVTGNGTIQPSRASPDLLKYIIDFTKNLSFSIEAVKKAPPFSVKTYGEVTFEGAEEMLTQMGPIGLEDKFLDLGSGVGNVVLQVAATVDCEECFGIELDKRRFQASKFMKINFENWMSWWGKKHSPIRFENGKFENTEFREDIIASKFIFANNILFDESNENLKINFIPHMMDWTKIVTTKGLVDSKTATINLRNIDDGSSILKMRKYKLQTKTPCSWNTCLDFYVHTIDRRRRDLFIANHEDLDAKKSIPSNRQADVASFKLNYYVVRGKKRTLLASDTRHHQCFQAQEKISREFATKTYDCFYAPKK